MIRKMHEIIHPTEYQKSFHVYFLIGQQKIPDQEAVLQFMEESLRFRDIIEYDQIDSYSQGSTKSLKLKVQIDPERYFEISDKMVTSILVTDVGDENCE